MFICYVICFVLFLVSHFQVLYIFTSLMVWNLHFIPWKQIALINVLFIANLHSFFFDYFVYSDSLSIKLIEKRNKNMPTWLCWLFDISFLMYPILYICHIKYFDCVWFPNIFSTFIGLLFYVLKSTNFLYVKLFFSLMI